MLSLVFVGHGFDTDWLFFAHGLKDTDHHFVAVIKLVFDFFEEIWAGLAVEIVSDVAGVVHEGKVTFLGDIEQTVLDSLNIWDFHVVGGWRHIFVLLTVEDIDSGHVDLGVTVLSGFRGGHIDDLAWLALHDDVASLSESRALEWVSEGSSVAGGFELFVGGHSFGLDYD